VRGRGARGEVKKLESRELNGSRPFESADQLMRCLYSSELYSTRSLVIQSSEGTCEFYSPSREIGVEPRGVPPVLRLLPAPAQEL